MMGSGVLSLSTVDGYGRNAYETRSSLKLYAIYDLYLCDFKVLSGGCQPRAVVFLLKVLLILR